MEAFVIYDSETDTFRITIPGPNYILNDDDMKYLNNGLDELLSGSTAIIETIEALREASKNVRLGR